jgi:hypothetical protein
MIQLDDKLFRFSREGTLDAYLVAPDFETAERIGKSSVMGNSKPEEVPGVVCISERLIHSLPYKIGKVEFAFEDTNPSSFNQLGWLVRDAGKMRVYRDVLERPLGDEAKLPQTNQVFFLEPTMKTIYSRLRAPLPAYP